MRTRLLRACSPPFNYILCPTQLRFFFTCQVKASSTEIVFFFCATSDLLLKSPPLNYYFSTEQQQYHLDQLSELVHHCNTPSVAPQSSHISSTDNSVHLFISGRTLAELETPPHPFRRVLIAPFDLEASAPVPSSPLNGINYV